MRIPFPQIFLMPGRAFLLLAALLICSPLKAATNYYFDINGASAGSGATSGSFAWSGIIWSTNTNGTVTTGTWTSRNNAVFSAGEDALYTNITMTGATGETASIIVRTGQVSIASLTRIFIGKSSLQTYPGTSLTIQNTPDFYNNIVYLDTAANSVISLAGANSGSRNAKLVKLGPGTAIFQGANQGSTGGSLTINEGEFQIRHTNAIPDGSTLVNPGGTLGLSNTITPTRPISLAGGTLRNIDSSNTISGTLTLSADSTIKVESASTLTLNPTSGLSPLGPFQLTAEVNGTLHLAKPVAVLSTLRKIGSGILIASAPNSFTGNTVVDSGTLRLVETAGVLGGTSGPITTNGTLEIINAAEQTVPNTLEGTSGLILKSGSGNLILSGSNTFTGTLRVTSGTLRIAAGATLPASLVELSPGAIFDVSDPGNYNLPQGQTLSGKGTLNGSLIAGTGSALSPGSPLTGAGTLTLNGDLSLPGGATLQFDFSNSQTANQLALTGNLTITGSNTVNITATNLPNGVYPLVRISGGTLSGDPASLKLTGFQSNTQIASLQRLPTGSGLQLVVENNTYIARSLIWTGNDSNLWDTTQLNWSFNNTSVPFTGTDRVTFSGNTAPNTSVLLNGELNPGSVTANTPSLLVITGSGKLVGGMSLVQSGSGILRIAASNAFTGGTSITAGTIEIGTATALGTGPVTNNSTLSFAGSESLEFSNPTSGPGTIRLTSGTTILSGSNTFTGPILISGGTLLASSPSALGASSSAIRIQPGGRYDLNGVAQLQKQVVLAGGILTNSATSGASLSSALIASEGSSIESSAPITLAAGINGTAPVIIQSGNVTLAGASTHSGQLTVRSKAQLEVVGSTGPGAVRIETGATLSGNGTVNGPLTLEGTINTGLSPKTLTLANSSTFAASANVILKIQKDPSGLASDQIISTGPLVLNGTLTITTSGLPLAAGDTIRLLNGTQIQGSFSTVKLPYLLNRLIWDQSELKTNGTLRVISLPTVSSQTQRRDWILTQIIENPTSIDGSVMAAAYFARGEDAKGRALALSTSRSVLANHIANQVQVNLFDIWPAVDLCIRYGDRLDPETFENIKQVATTFVQYKDTVTANLRTLAWVTRYLASELFGEESFTSLNITNYWRATDTNAKAELQRHFRDAATTGYGELASRPYYWKNLLPMLSIGQLSKDPAMRNAATMAFEAGLAQNAGAWMRGHLGIATTRSYPDVLNQYPVTSLGMLWFYFGGEIPPTNAESAVFTAVMNQPVSPVITTAGSDRSQPFATRSWIAGGHQSNWVDRDYILFSDGPISYGNFQVYPNGVVWCEPNLSRWSFLWVAKPWVDDQSKMNISNPHGRNSSQYKEAQSRDAVVYIYNIPATGDAYPYALGYVPGGYRAALNESASTGHIFLHYGSVLIAIRSEIPFTWDPATGVKASGTTIHPGDSDFRVFGTQFALAIETANASDFAGASPEAQLDLFRSAILATPAPTHSSTTPPSATYTSRRGDSIQVTLSKDPNSNPVIQNGMPVNYNVWPMLENPWMFQRRSDPLLTLFTPNYRELLDFSNWTRRKQYAPSLNQPTTAYTAVSGASVDVDLSTYGVPNSAESTSLRYSVSPVPADQGTVTMLPDGKTARYTPAAGFRGDASIRFSTRHAGVDPSQLVFLYDYENEDLSDNLIRDQSGHRLDGITSAVGGATLTLTNDVPHALSGSSSASILLNESGSSAARLTHGLAVTEHDLSNADWTFATWVKRSSTSNDDFILYVGSGDGLGGSGDELQLYLPAGANTVKAVHYNSANTVDLNLASDAVATAGTWHHVALSFTRTALRTGVIRLYLNGRLQTESPPVSWSLNQSSAIAIGGCTATSTGINRWFNGRFDDTALFSRTLSHNDILTLSNMSVAHFTGLAVSGNVTVTVKTPLEQWRATHFGSSSNTGTSADSADPDNDGAPNLLEYALGTSPTTATSVGSAQTGINNGKLTLTYFRARPEITYTVEASSDLTNWTAISVNAGNVGESVTVTDTVSPATTSPARRFIRLRISLP